MPKEREKAAMKITLRDSETYSTRHIADNCFYYIPLADQCVLCSTFSEAMEYIPRPDRVLDPVALLSVIQFGWVCGDRTLISGLKRLPLHSTIDARGTIQRHLQFPHGTARPPVGEIASCLTGLLSDEVEKTVQEERVVYLLLSGGLDSRIIAGLLRRLQPKYD